MAFADIYARDTAIAYREVGLPVVYGDFRTFGVLLLEPTDVLSMNDKNYAVQDNTLTLTLATGSIGVIRNNSLIGVDGKTYKINKPLLLGNGLETKLWLSEAGS